MLLQDFHPIIQYLRQHPHVGQLFAFLVAFAESLPILGTIIPGTVTMTIVGILIGSSALAGTTTVLVTAFAALAGDTIGFLIGFYYNDRLRNVWPFRRYPKWLTLAEAFFLKHGGKSILIGRFVGPARSTVPLVAGLFKVSWSRFFLAAIPSALLWAIAYLLPGIVIGALAQEIPKGEATRFMLIALAIIAAIWFIFWVIQHFFIQLARGINHLTDKIWQGLINKKYCRGLIKLIQNPDNPEDHHQLTLCLGAIVTGLLFLVLLGNVMMQGALTNANKPLFHLFQSMHLPTVKPWFVITTILFSPLAMLVASTIIALGFFITKQFRYGFHTLGSIFLTAGSIFVFKNLSHSPRPEGFQIVASSSSFPSGHTALTTVTLGLIAYIINEKTPPKWHFITYTATVLLAILTGISRLYLGAHWLTDIIGSYLLATTILFLAIVSLRKTRRRLKQNKTSIGLFSLIIVLGFVISWPLNLIKSYHHDMYRYTRVWPKKVIHLNQWWHSPSTVTPLYRANRLGHAFQPFNLQWAGNLSQIKKMLIRNHWKIIEQKYHLKTALQRFASKNPRYHMPLFPWLYHDKSPKLVAIKRTQNSDIIFELRLWQSHISFYDTHSPLWLGAINYRLPPQKLFSYEKRAKVSMQIGTVINTLFKLTQPFEIRQLKVSTAGSPIKWSGNMLLMRPINPITQVT